MPPAPCLSVLVLTEDGSDHAHDTLRVLVKRLFAYLDERCQTQKIDFQPPNEASRREVVANTFAERKRSDRVRLYQYLAAHLRDDQAFVVHHVDADRRWDDRYKDPSVKVDQVRREVLPHVRTILSKFYADLELDRRLERYLLLVPYWELEAWLYQHTDLAEKLCREHTQCRGQHAPLLAAWRDDRGALDDREDPSDLLPCAGKRHNKELAAGIPLKPVIGAGKSLAAAVETLLACEPLLDALARTYEAPSS